MRIWDLEPACLCRSHLLGEHRELHAVWAILTQDKRGYRHHPETRRWEGKLAALYRRHEALVAEMTRRGYRHASPLDRMACSVLLHSHGEKTVQVSGTPIAASRRVSTAVDVHRRIWLGDALGLGFGKGRLERQPLHRLCKGEHSRASLKI